MGKNKLAKFAELETLSHVFQVSSSEILRGDTFSLKGKWNELFFKNSNPIILELGCGKGEYTVELAKRFPNNNYIGVDIKGARLWTGAKEALTSGLNNVAFIRTNIEMITHFFGSGEISEIWLTFPDPQMKKTTKRLTATNFIQLYLNILRKDGVVHLKTDSNFMFIYTLEMIKENQFLIIKKTENVHLTSAEDDILKIKTYYESQWLERGLNIKYVSFVPLAKEKYLEPDIDIEYDEYRSFKRLRRQ